MTEKREKRPRVLEVPATERRKRPLPAWPGFHSRSFAAFAAEQTCNVWRAEKYFIPPPPRKLCDERCRKVFMERLSKIESA